MTHEQITALTATGESETLEFKHTTGTRREAVSTVCAMLNQRGGHVLFGVTPEGDVVGQQVSERTIEEVSAKIQRIEPSAFTAVSEFRQRKTSRWEFEAAGLVPKGRGIWHTCN